MAPLEADIPQMVRELCLSLDNFWFSAHLLDLLHHDGRERPAQHSHSDVQGAWHESASKLEQRRSNGLGAHVSGLEVHHLLADKILAEYSTSGTFSSTDLNSPGASIVVSDRLTFLGKYREFHKLVKAGAQVLLGDPSHSERRHPDHTPGRYCNPSTYVVNVYGKAS